MKKQLVVSIFLIVLMSSLSIISVKSLRNTNPNFESPEFAATIRPVFEGADVNTSVIVERDDASSTGAIIKATPHKNVTIWYSYVGGNNESAPLLFGDDGTSTPDSLSWVDGKLMTYDYEKTASLGGGVSAFYNYTFNLSSQFVVFRARYVEYEDDINIPNLITTGVWIKSYFLQEFYTQFDAIDMNITMYNYNISSYGLLYRKVTPDNSEVFQNVTFSSTQEGTEANVTASFVNKFKVGTEVEVRAFIMHYDNITNQYRILQENKAHFLTIVDGSPEVTVSTEKFTNSLNISIEWQASAPKANITAVDIDWGDSSAIQSVSNLSIHVASHLYPSAGEYTINVTAFAGLAVKSELATILIDQDDPSGTIKLKLTNGTLVDLSQEVFSLETEVKEITLAVSGSDVGGSGVAQIEVITDEGNSIARDSDGEVTILFLDYGLHEITLKVTDNAGNVYTRNVVINLVEPEFPKDFGVPFPFGVVTVIALFSLVFLYKKRRK
ncbi:MAG: hypothetical protein ACTSSG_00250 [Candidatus Heimdallarchaeaceae archaeon]